MSSEIPWYQDFFGEDYLRIYMPFLPRERTMREVKGIIRLLDLPQGCSILDLCCGYGRHTLPLAQAGYHMIGQDLSEILLHQARVAANHQDIDVKWIHSDMRHVPFDEAFDAIINVFTSFGYLESEEEDQQVLLQVYKALKPGGLFLLETVYQNKFVRSFSPHGILRYDDGLIVMEERRFDLLRSRNEIVVTLLFPDGQRTTHHQSMRMYTLTELVRMFSTAGLSLHGYYGDLDGSALTMDSRLVVIGRKEL